MAPRPGHRAPTPSASASGPASSALFQPLACALEHPAWPTAVLGLALLLRIAHVLSLRTSPWFEHLVVDPQYYDEWAQHIAGGAWMGDRAFYMDPLYPYVLGLVYAEWGRNLMLVRLLQVAVSAGSCVLVRRLGTHVGGRVIGGLAALGFAIYKPEIFYVAEVDKTCLSVFLTAAALALMLRSSLPARLGAGFVLGLAALTRANLLLLAPLGVLRILLDRDARRAGPPGARRPVVGAALFAVGLVLSLLPVAWHNHRVSGGWVLTTSQAGQNFYTGNNPTNPYGAYGALPFVRGNPHFEEADFRAAAEAREGRRLGPGEVSAFWFAQAFEHMRDHPGFAARAMLRKIALFWNDFEISDNQDQYLLERDSWVLRLPLLGFGSIAPLALLGAIAVFRSRRAARLLCGFVVLYGASVIAFFIFSRYRIQVVPALLPLAAAGAVELAVQARGRHWARLAMATGIVLGTSLFCFHTIGIFSRHDPLVIEMQLQHLGEIYLTAGRPERAIEVYQEGVGQCVIRCSQTLEALADVYLATDRLDEGVAYFRRHIREHPQDPEGRRHLARLLEAAGRHDEAPAARPGTAMPP